MLHATHYTRLRRYVFHVRAADSAGHVGTAASYGWAFASVLPVLVLEARPPAVSGWSEAAMVVTLGADNGESLASVNATFLAKVNKDAEFRVICAHAERCTYRLAHLATGTYSVTWKALIDGKPISDQQVVSWDVSVCTAEQYSTTTPTGALTCVACPDGAICAGACCKSTCDVLPDCGVVW